MNVDYLSYRRIQIIIGYTNYLFKIDMVMSEPEFWIESETEGCGASLLTECLCELMQTGITISNVWRQRLKLFFR